MCQQRWSCLFLFLALASTAVIADDRKAADLLPESTVIYAELAEPSELLATLLEHPLRSRILELKPVRDAMEQKPYLDFKAGVAAVESQMGLPWHKIIRQVAGGGLALAVDAKTQGTALLAQAVDESSQSKLIEVLHRLAEALALPFRLGLRELRRGGGLVGGHRRGVGDDHALRLPVGDERDVGAGGGCECNDQERGERGAGHDRSLRGCGVAGAGRGIGLSNTPGAEASANWTRGATSGPRRPARVRHSGPRGMV